MESAIPAEKRKAERSDAYGLSFLSFAMFFLGAMLTPTMHPSSEPKEFYYCCLAGAVLSYLSFRRKRNLFALILFPAYMFFVLLLLFSWYYGLYQGTIIIAK